MTDIILTAKQNRGVVAGGARPWVQSGARRHVIALALLSFLILGAAFLQDIAARVVVFITGMIMAPPFV
jgi:hypothetical protein